MTNWDKLIAEARAATPGPWQGFTEDDIAAWMIFGADGWAVASATVVPDQQEAQAVIGGVPRANHNTIHIARYDPATVELMLVALQTAEEHGRAASTECEELTDRHESTCVCRNHVWAREVGARLDDALAQIKEALSG